ncbi:DUF255 domain-containing protein [Lacihabitans sp. LS3-19]|uniref:thioredoxin family protein n=1 Tax=Lacihabitans sp. LS3-19 TaxID=2487335 RepID=UPI0020CFCF24|nr:thioredoxin family protein [Lacihabitans sp. LS3-19]MCP9768560.1 DUF255 domain-containing protein [Lacihabitans sp. LS3-19]
MKRINLFTLTFLLISKLILAQSTTTQINKKLYDPTEDAKAEIASAIKKANAEGKHVLLQIGGNWCSWCLLFDRKINSNDTLRNAVDKNFVIYHLNYSPENYNKEVLASLDFPQRFGFPVFVVLDGKGNRIHTENSAYLEEGKGHSTKKVLAFFQNWSPSALDPKHYEK